MDFSLRHVALSHHRSRSASTLPADKRCRFDAAGGGPRSARVHAPYDQAMIEWQHSTWGRRRTTRVDWEGLASSPNVHLKQRHHHQSDHRRFRRRRRSITLVFVVRPSFRCEKMLSVSLSHFGSNENDNDRSLSVQSKIGFLAFGVA